jgi:hypothetical protein
LECNAIEEELQMPDDVIVKVKRTIMAYWNPVEISTKGGTLVMQFLPEDVKHRMGGEGVVYFHAEQKDGRWLLKSRAPKQSW